MKFALFLSLILLGSWTNYLGNQTCSPCHYFEPKTLEELCNTIKSAASVGKVRVVGGGYSISALVCTDGSLVNLKHLDQILSVDVEKKQVHVEAGITLHELSEQLASYNLALPNLPAFDQVSLGGALCTAVHGTGHTGTLSNFVTKIDLITSDGVIHELTASDPETFASAKVSLGALGVIYAVTLQCEDLFYLKLDHQTVDLTALKEHYHEWLAEHEFFQCSWNVESGKVLITTWDRCLSSSEPSYKALPYHKFDPSDKDLFSEIAIPTTSLPFVLTQLESFLKEYQGPQIADIVVRFVEKDEDAYLSPASNGPVAYLTMSIPQDNNPLDFYEAFEEFMLQFQGRPHWGKINFMDHEKALNLYPNLEKFIQTQQKLDPHDTFSNPFIDQICG